MRLGLSTYTFPWSIGVPGYPPEKPLAAMDLLEQAVSLGVGVVQIADNLPLDELPERELADLESCARRYNLQIEVGARGIAPGYLLRYLELARRFRSPVLRTVIDTADHHPSPEEVELILQPLRSEFEQAGITLAIENHDRFPALTLVGIVRRLGSWVGICLDTVNSFGALEGPQAVMDTLGPLVVNLHVKDFTIFRAGHMMGLTIAGRPAGRGMLDVPWLLGELRRHGRDPNAILELWTPPEQTLAGTIAKELRWAEESIAYLREFIPA